jgi:hypothetical protein
VTGAESVTFNLVSASAATGVSRSTILRSIKAGRLSAERDATNGWSIQPAELFRVFPALPLPQPADGQPAAQQDDRLLDQLRTQVADLRTLLEQAHRREEDLREDRDAWRQAFQDTNRQLTGPEPSNDQPRNKRGTWWPWRRAG